LARVSQLKAVGQNTKMLLELYTPWAKSSPHYGTVTGTLRRWYTYTRQRTMSRTSSCLTTCGIHTYAQTCCYAIMANTVMARGDTKTKVFTAYMDWSIAGYAAEALRGDAELLCNLIGNEVKPGGHLWVNCAGIYRRHVVVQHATDPRETDRSVYFLVHDPPPLVHAESAKKDDAKEFTKIVPVKWPNDGCFCIPSMASIVGTDDQDRAAVQSIANLLSSHVILTE
jgi:hypothetical protein